MTRFVRRTMESARSDDSGFTLVELVVAMFITLLVMTSMLGIVVNSLSSVGKSKQRQAGTAQVNQAMEQLRALPYDSLTIATGTTVAAGDPNLDYSATPPLLKISVGCTAPTPACEPLVINSYSPKTTTNVVDGVSYVVTSYVTKPPAGATGAQTFNLTTYATYSSSVSKGKQASIQHSTTFSPVGCLSTASHPFSGPCQTYFTIQAGMADSGVSITKAHVSLDPAHPNAINGLSLANDIGEVDLGFPTLSTGLLIEQTVSGKGTVAMTDGRLVSDSGAVAATTGGDTASAAVDTDPSTTTAQTDGPTSVTQSAPSRSTPGGVAGTLTVTPMSTGTGSIAAGTSANTSLCVGADSLATGLVTGATTRPCVSGQVQPTGAPGTIVFNMASPFGFGAANFVAAQFDPWSKAARAVSAQLTAANASACTSSPGPTSTGCGHAHASRTIDRATFGGMPSVSTPSPAVPGATFVNSWSVTNLVEDAYAESGVGSRVPASYTRSGTLSYWCPTLCPGAVGGYKSIALTGTPGPTPPAYLAEPYTTTYTKPTGTVTFKVESTITVSQPLVGASVPDPTCKTASCAYSARDAQGVLGQTTYTISFTDNSGVTTELSSFVIVANLGGLIAQSSMKVAS